MTVSAGTRTSDRLRPRIAELFSEAVFRTPTLLLDHGLLVELGAPVS
jgi:hypothetical protein